MEASQLVGASKIVGAAVDIVDISQNIGPAVDIMNISHTLGEAVNMVDISHTLGASQMVGVSPQRDEGKGFVCVVRNLFFFPSFKRLMNYQ